MRRCSQEKVEKSINTASRMSIPKTASSISIKDRPEIMNSRDVARAKKYKKNQKATAFTALVTEPPSVRKG